MELNLKLNEHGLDQEDLDALKSGKFGFRPGGAAAMGLRECRRIAAEREASPAWNAKPGAQEMRYALACAIEALSVCDSITYFETDDQPKPR
jgi:hypothetical protein